VMSRLKPRPTKLIFEMACSIVFVPRFVGGRTHFRRIV